MIRIFLETSPSLTGNRMATNLSIAIQTKLWEETAGETWATKCIDLQVIDPKIPSTYQRVKVEPVAIETISRGRKTNGKTRSDTAMFTMK